MRDLFSHINPKPALSPVQQADDTPYVGEIIDRQGFESLLYIILVGAVVDTDATFVVLLEHGDDSGLSDAAAVPDSDLNGTELLATFLFSDDDVVRKLGYVGNKRYTRLTITPTGNGSALSLGAVALQGNPHQENPLANPPT